MRQLLLLIISTILLAGDVFAENIYIAQSSSGSSSGLSCASAHDVTWFNNIVSWANPKQPGKIGPGDTVHLCGTISTQLMIRASGNAGSPITILFEDNAKLSAGTWAAATGALSISGHNYVTIDGGNSGIIEATDNGTTAIFGGTKTYSSDIYGIYINNCISCEVRNLIIQNIYDRLDNSADCNRNGRGIYVSGNFSNLSIHDNTIAKAYRGISLAYSSGSTVTNVNIYGNTFRNCSLGLLTSSANVNYHLDILNVYNNTITGGSVWNGTWDSSCVNNGCNVSCATDLWHHQDGMQIGANHSGSSITNLRIYSNYLQDFGTHSTGHIYVTQGSTGTVDYALIFNNVLVYTAENYSSNGGITIGNIHGTRIYNNTIVGKSDSPGYTNGNGILLKSNTTATDIKNNIINHIQNYIYAYGVPVNEITSNNNNYYGCKSGWGFVGINTSLISFAAWKSILGSSNETYTSTEDPQLDSNYRLTASTPYSVKYGGVNFSSIFSFDFKGAPRPSLGNWAIGADQRRKPSKPSLHAD